MRDLSRYRVTEERNVSRHLFYTDSHEGNLPAFSISLIPLNQPDYKFGNFLLSKYQDQSYYSKLENLFFLNRSTQVDLTKFDSQGTEQTVDFDSVTEQVQSFFYRTIEQDTVSNQLDLDEFPYDGAHTVITPKKVKTTGTISANPVINFTGANSFLIDILIKAVIAKLPIETFLSARIYSVDSTFLNTIYKRHGDFSLIISGTEIIINSEESAMNAIRNIPAGFTDHKSDVLIQSEEPVNPEIFESLDIVATLSTVDSLQTSLNFNLNEAKNFMLIVPFATPKKYSYNLADNFFQITHSIENDGGDNSLAALVQEFRDTFQLSKNEISAFINQINNSILSDQSLNNIMKIANIKGVLNFNLQGVSYES